MRKRIASIVLSVCLCLTLLPTAAFAASANDEYTADDGIKYTLSSEGEANTATVSGYDYSTLSGDITIPAKVTVNGTEYTVTSIGEAAFWYSQLTSIIIPEGVTSIGKKAFGFSKLTSITIPDSVTSIGMEAFTESDLTSINIPKGVTTIDSSAFYGCPKLREITVTDENSSYVADDGVLFNRDKTTLVCYPMAKSGDQYTIPDSVKTIGRYAFAFCTMTSITIPERVETIDDYAFMECAGWTDITIPGSVKTIGKYAFARCTMTSITIPEGVTSIGECAFNTCKNLTSIIIPSSVKTIGGNVFYNCGKFETVYYVGDESSWSGITIDSTNKISDKVVYCHAVTLDLNGGTGDTSGLINRKNANVLATDPTRSGYTFAGWYTEKDGGEKVNANNYSSCSTIYAGWRKNIGGSDVLSDITITCESSTLIYNAKAQSPTVTVTDGEKTLTLDTDYTLSGNTGTDVNTYTLTITGKGNYAGTVTKDWSIAPKEISVTGATAVNRAYEKDDTTVEISSVTFDDATLTRGTDYTAIGTMADADAGDNKQVSVTVELKGTAARNYTLNGSTTTTTVKIEKTSYAGTTTADGSTKYGASGTVDLSELIAAGGTATLGTVTDGNSVLNTENGMPKLDGNKLQFALANDAALVGKTADIEVSVSGCTNYTDYKITVTLTVDDKLTPTVTAPTAIENLTYNGSDQTLINAASTTGGTLQYSLNNSTWSETLPTGKDATSYTVYYKVVGNADYADVAANSISVTIGKKAVTVKPQSYTITKGNAIPAFALEYDGLVSGDSLTTSAAPTFTCYEADGNTAVSTSTVAGSYTITWTNSDAFDFTSETNYAVTKETTGTLTINNKPSSSGSSSSTTSTTVKNPDGSTTTTVTDKKTGTVTETTTTPNGTTSTTVTDKNGNSTTTVSVSKKDAQSGETITLPVDEVTAAGKSENAQEISVEVPSGGATIEVPVKNPTPGTVVVIVDKNGNETVVPTTKQTENGVSVTLTENATIKVIENSKDFSDVKSSDYFDKAVDWASSRGITGGNSATTFGPHDSCTRAQLVTFLWRAAGQPAAKSESGMTDVATNTYYTDAVAWAFENEIVGGYGNGQFGSEDTITREQMATILYRFAQKTGMDTTQGGMAVREYKDYDSISDYALTAIQWAVNAGVMQGYDGNLMPSQPCTRAQIVTMLYRLLGA